MENIDFEKIKRISIIGGPGTGKTTLTNNLGKILNLPITHIDGIHHLKNWETRDKNERDTIIINKLEEEKWIIDGTYRDTLEIRIKKSDLVIFLNYSKFAMVKGILSRYFKNKDREKPEIPGCKEQMTFHFIRYTFNWKKIKYQFIKETLEKHKDKRILEFKSRKKLNEWYKEQFGESIKV